MALARLRFVQRALEVVGPDDVLVFNGHSGPLSPSTLQRSHAWQSASPVSGSFGRPTGMTATLSEFLLRRSHQDLIHRHTALPGDNVGDHVGDVLGFEPLDRLSISLCAGALANRFRFGWIKLRMFTTRRTFARRCGECHERLACSSLRRENPALGARGPPSAVLLLTVEDASSRGGRHSADHARAA